MVSFFGLKLGSDKKKAQSKAQNKAPPRPDEWPRFDQNTLADAHQLGHNFSRPQFPSSNARPGTANSTRDTGNWRTVFQNPAMTSSMVDLAPPQRRQPSMSSLRHAASDLSMRPDIPLPPVFGGSGPLPGTPTRPTSSRKSEWINPLAVHFCKYPTSNNPESVPGLDVAVNTVSAASVANPGTQGVLRGLDSFQSAGAHSASTRALAMRSPNLNQMPATKHGYPSPPQSDGNSERTLSPIDVSDPERFPPNGHYTPLSSPRKGNAPGPTDLPSPASSKHSARDDNSEVPVIRSVPARRETHAFHQPRGRSYTMEFEGPHQATMLQLPKEEGFSGNFLDFDFGEIVTKTTNKNDVQNITSTPDPAVPRISSDIFRVGKISDSKIVPEKSSTVFYSEVAMRPIGTEGPRSLALSHLSDEDTASSALIDQMPTPPRNNSQGLSGGVTVTAANDLHGLDSISKISPRQGFQSRFDSGTSSRAPPPRPLRSPVSFLSAGNINASPKSPYGPPPDSASSYVRTDDASPQVTKTTPDSPFSKPMEGDFPVSKGLPRGRQPGPPPLRPPPEPEHDKSGPLLQNWSDLDEFEARRSALPVPLITTRPSTSHGETSTPASMSGRAPRIPSQTFSSLLQSINNLSSSFGGSFEIDFDGPLSTPTFGGRPTIVDHRPSTAAGPSSIRFEVERAPPRPGPTTLAPSTNTGAAASSPLKSPKIPGVSTSFI